MVNNKFLKNIGYTEDMEIVEHWEHSKVINVRLIKKTYKKRKTS